MRLLWPSYWVRPAFTFDYLIPHADQTTGDFTRNGWTFPRIAGDPSHFDDDLKDKAVPTGVVEIISWLEVIPRRPLVERSRPYVVIRNRLDGLASGIAKEVVIRIQGFVGSLNLHPVGNWDR